ncbi:MAG: hypothetical protein KAS32_04435 [Candidatus Peribacteraceae bacterium]|nr:hypothetical protein [Candidatus Peribacteraceae bacterium]
MNKYICTGCSCEVIADEPPPKCPDCNATDKIIKIDKPVSESIDVKEEIHETESLGFGASPAKIKNIINLAVLPSGNTPYYDEIYFNIDEKSVSAYMIANGQTLISVLEIKKEYFDEVWGIGKLPIKAEETLEHIGVLSSYSKMAIQLDTVNKRIIHNAGAKASFADLAESTKQIMQSRENGEEFNFDNENFLPVFAEGATFSYKAVIDVKELSVLLKVAAKKGIDYYPIEFGNGSFKTSVGNMLIPTKGAFNLDIHMNMDKSVFPPEPLRIDAGSAFRNVIENLSGEIAIHFIDNGMPIWISSEIKTKKKVRKEGEGEEDTVTEDVIGRMGYLISLRTKDNED